MIMENKNVHNFWISQIRNFNNSNFKNDDFKGSNNVNIVNSPSNDNFNVSSEIHVQNINRNQVSHELDLNSLTDLKKKFTNTRILGY